MNKNPKHYKKIIPLIVTLVFILAGICGLIHSCFYQSTNNAFIEAQMVYFSPKVSGEIIELNVDNNQEIKKGEIIAQIDPKDFESALNNAQTRLEKAQTDLKISTEDVDKMNAVNLSAKNEIKNAKSKLENANNDYIRYKNAYQDGSVTKQDLNNAIKNLTVAKAQYKSAQDQSKAAANALQSALAKKTSQNTQIQQLLSEVEQARLNLSYTTLISPVDGAITNKNIETGSRVDPQNSIMTIIPKECYVIANFKETQIKNMKKGQKAAIKIETIPSKKFKGKVDSIQKASEKTNQNISVKIIFNEDVSSFNIAPKTNAAVKVKVIQ